MNRINKIVFAVLMLVTFKASASLSDISAVLLPGTVSDHYGNPELSSAITPEEAARSMEPFPIGQGSTKQGKGMVLLASNSSKFVDFGEYQSYAFLVEFDAAMPEQKMRLNGYMIKPDKGKKYILYPLATAFDEQKNRLETLQPLNESDIKGNTISNIVNLPAGTKYLLLHTHPAYLTFDINTGETVSKEEISAGLTALGGALGGLFQGILSNSQVQRGKVGVAPVGIVEVMRYEP
jgi:hypothetical protein